MDDKTMIRIINDKYLMGYDYGMFFVQQFGDSFPDINDAQFDYVLDNVRNALPGVSFEDMVLGYRTVEDFENDGGLISYDDCWMEFNIPFVLIEPLDMEVFDVLGSLSDVDWSILNRWLKLKRN